MALSLDPAQASELFTVPVRAEAIELKQSFTASTDTSRALNRAIEQIERVGFDMNPAPSRFVGRIRKYKFRPGGVDEYPEHVFRVVSDRNVEMVCRLSADRFASMMFGMDMKPRELVGRMVFLMIESGVGLVPTNLVDDAQASDKWGNQLFIGAPIVGKYSGAQKRGIVVTQANADGEIRVRYDGMADGDSTYVNPSGLTRGF